MWCDWSSYIEDNTVCIFVGYSDMHVGDCCGMFDPKTKRVHTNRDFRWLMRWYYIIDSKKNDTISVSENDILKVRKGDDKIDDHTFLDPIPKYEEETYEVPRSDSNTTLA